MWQMEFGRCDKYLLCLQALGSFHRAIRLLQNSSAIRISDTRLLSPEYLATYQTSPQGVTLPSNTQAAVLDISFTYIDDNGGMHHH